MGLISMQLASVPSPEHRLRSLQVLHVVTMRRASPARLSGNRVPGQADHRAPLLLSSIVAACLLGSGCVVVTKSSHVPPAGVSAGNATPQSSGGVTLPPNSESPYVSTPEPISPTPYSGTLTVGSDQSGSVYVVRIGAIIQVRLNPPGPYGIWKGPFLSPTRGAALTLLVSTRDASGVVRTDYKAVAPGSAVVCAFQAPTPTPLPTSPPSAHPTPTSTPIPPSGSPSPLAYAHPMLTPGSGLTSPLAPAPVSPAATSPRPPSPAAQGSCVGAAATWSFEVVS